MSVFYKKPTFTKNQINTLVSTASSTLKAQAQTDYVNVSGDTMTGDLSIPNTLNVATLSGYQSDVILPANNIVIGNHANPLSAVHATVFHFEPQVTEPSSDEGSIYYDDGDKTLTMVSDIPDARLQIGQELWIRVKNSEVDQLDNGTVVYISSGSGGLAYVKRAKADTEDTSATTLAVITHNIAPGAEGYATSFGLVREIDTSMWDEGDMLYLSPLSAGYLTNVKPEAPQHLVVVAYNTKKHASAGNILVSINNGWELYELHDAYYDPNTILNGNMLAWNNVSSRWEDTSAIQVVDNDVTINTNLSVGDYSYYGIGWRDLVANFANLQTAQGTPNFTPFVDSNVKALAFKTNDAVAAAFHIDHDYLSGSPIYPHVHWCTGTTNTNWVRWKINYVVGKGHAQGSESIFTSGETIFLEQSGTGTAYEHMITEIPAPGILNDKFETDALILMTITRVAATSGANFGEDDTGPGASVYGLFADIHYQSTKAVTINKAPPFDG